MELSVIIRYSLLGLCFLLLVVLFVIKTPKAKDNWAVFYALLWTIFSLAILNYIAVENNLWYFIDINPLIINMPLDIFFIWIVLWGVLPVYFFKGKHTFILALFIFWLDILLMPELEKLGILKLNDYWIIGDLILVLLVWLPAYLWAKFYYNNTHLKYRSFFQVIIMTLLLSIAIPFIAITYTNATFNLKPFNPYLFQIIFIIALPSLIAVMDLAYKGKGTPFPYDKTSKLVTNGVYAYCKNPIQWSFTLLFIPLSIYYESYLILMGSIISIAYAIGISNPQEYNDMNIRFGEDWTNYKHKVPSWRFSWKPRAMPKGTIYFKKHCNPCEQIKLWFTTKTTQQLDIKFSEEYINSGLLQVTYVDYLGTEHKSIKAIAHALEHINLGYASLGWFMRLPIVSPILQYIIDAMDFEKSDNDCIFEKTNKD